MLTKLRDVLATVAVEDGVKLIAITDVEDVDVSIFVAFAPALHAAGAISHVIILVIQSIFVCSWRSLRLATHFQNNISLLKSKKIP